MPAAADLGLLRRRSTRRKRASLSSDIGSHPQRKSKSWRLALLASGLRPTATDWGRRRQSPTWGLLSLMWIPKPDWRPSDSFVGDPSAQRCAPKEANPTCIDPGCAIGDTQFLGFQNGNLR